MQIRRKPMVSIKFSEQELKFIIIFLSMMEHLPPKVLDPERKNWIIMLRMKFLDAFNEFIISEVHYEPETDQTEY